MPHLACAVQSLSVAEPLYGTAPHARAWLFLEHTGPWGAKLIPESGLPSDIQTLLQSLKQTAHARISFIRRGGETPPPWRLWLWRADATEEHCAQWRLPSLDALHNLPLREWLSGAQPLPEEARCKEPHYLVCVNARRDACCGRLGPRLYRALRDLRADQVWMTTHVGGHRFAPNLLVLPYGLSYGRVHAPEHAAAIVQATEAHEVHLGLLRGRLSLPQPAQAAEHFLRLHTGQRALEAYTLAWLREEEGLWEAAFVQDDRGYLVHLRRQASPLKRSPSCGAAPQPVNRFVLQAIAEHPLRRYRAAGGVVLNPQDQVLVLLRPARREVRLPKGHIEPGEDAWATARREIAEEAGLPAEGLRLLADLGQHPVGFLHQGRLVWREEHYFLARWEKGALNPPEAQFIPLWLDWERAAAALTYPAEQEWLRRAQAAFAGIRA